MTLISYNSLGKLEPTYFFLLFTARMQKIVRRTIKRRTAPAIDNPMMSPTETKNDY